MCVEKDEKKVMLIKRDIRLPYTYPCFGGLTMQSVCAFLKCNKSRLERKLRSMIKLKREGNLEIKHIPIHLGSSRYRNPEPHS